MINLINLFFNLGLHVSNSKYIHSTNIYSYLIGYKYTNNIFNIQLSILYIRRCFIFLLTANKFNYKIMPVVSDINLFKEEHFEQIEQIGGYVFLLKFFRKHKYPILLNKIGLLTNWYIYYTFLINKIFKVRFFNQKSKKLNDYFKNDLKVFSKKKTNLVCSFLLLYIYYLFHRKMLTNETFLENGNEFFRSLKKFYVFLKIILYLYDFKKIPDILFYFNPAKYSLSDIVKFRICTISLIDTHVRSTHVVTYPIPTNFSSCLATIFYSNLFLNSYYLGKILLLVNSLK